MDNVYSTLNSTQIDFVRLMTRTSLEFLKLGVLKILELRSTSSEDLFYEKIIQSDDFDDLKLFSKYTGRELCLRMLSSSEMNKRLYLSPKLQKKFDLKGAEEEDMKKIREKVYLIQKENERMKLKVEMLKGALGRTKSDIQSQRKEFIRKIVRLEQKIHDMVYSKAGYSRMLNDLYSVYNKNKTSIREEKKVEVEDSNDGKEDDVIRKRKMEVKTIAMKMNRSVERNRIEVSLCLEENRRVINELRRYKRAHLTISKSSQTTPLEDKVLTNSYAQTDHRQNEEVRVRGEEGNVGKKKVSRILNEDKDSSMKSAIQQIPEKVENVLQKTYEKEVALPHPKRESLKDEFYHFQRPKDIRIIIKSQSKIDGCCQTSPVSLFPSQSKEEVEKQSKEEVEKQSKEEVEKEVEVVDKSLIPGYRKTRSYPKKADFKNIREFKIMKSEISNLTVKNAMQNKLVEKLKKQLESLKPLRNKSVKSTSLNVTATESQKYEPLVDRNESPIRSLAAVLERVKWDLRKEKSEREKETEKLRSVLEIGRIRTLELKNELNEVRQANQKNHNKILFQRKLKNLEEVKTGQHLEIKRLTKKVSKTKKKMEGLEDLVDEFEELARIKELENEEITSINKRFVDFLCNKCTCNVGDTVLKSYLFRKFKKRRSVYNFEKEKYVSFSFKKSPNLFVRPVSSLKPKRLSFKRKELKVILRRPKKQGMALRKKITVVKKAKTCRAERVRQSLSSIRHQSRKEEDLVRITSTSSVILTKKNVKEEPIDSNRDYFPSTGVSALIEYNPTLKI